MPCFFCQRNIKEIDFTDVLILKRFVSGLYKIKSKRKTGNCSKHQRKISKAIKKARILGLLPHAPK